MLHRLRQFLRRRARLLPIVPVCARRGFGRQPPLPPRGNETTHPPRHSFHNEYSARIPDAVHVPIAAPAVRKDGIGPSPRIRTTLNMTFITVSAKPRISGVRASPAERRAPETMK